MSEAGGSSRWPFGDLRLFSYGAILADPPWRFANFSAKGEEKNPTAHYPCMSFDELAALPVNHLAASDCAIFMWATAPMLPDALRLLDAWGFTFKTMGAWAKQSSTGASWAFGTGYVFRSALEPYLIGTRGHPVVRSRSVRNLIVAPVREHSRKPRQAHRDVESLFDGPYAELFAREAALGWDVWGNQTGKFDNGGTADRGQGAGSSLLSTRQPGYAGAATASITPAATLADGVAA